MSNQNPDEKRKRAAELYAELDSMARAFDSHEYGLPFTTEAKDCGVNAILDFAQQVAAESAPQWIPVSTPPQIPDGLDEVEVLVYRVNEYGDSQIMTDFYYQGDGWCDDTITHWQPLPPAPEKGE